MSTGRTFPSKDSDTATMWFDADAESGATTTRVKIETNVAESTPHSNHVFIPFEVTSPWRSMGHPDGVDAIDADLVKRAGGGGGEGPAPPVVNTATPRYSPNRPTSHLDFTTLISSRDR